MRGSTVKRGRTWSYVLYLGRDATGRKRQKWVGGFNTRRDAEEALVAALGKRRDGIAVDSGRMTVGQYLDEWLTGITPSLRPTTAQSYRKLMRDLVIRHVGNVRLVDLTAPRIRMLHGELLENGRLDTQGGRRRRPSPPSDACSRTRSRTPRRLGSCRATQRRS